MEKDPLLQKAINLLGPQCEFAFLLGSYGTPRFHKESDVDLACYFKQKKTFEELAKIHEQLSNIFNCDVDLVSLNQIDPIFSRQVLETGRLIINNNEDLRLKWTVTQTSIYIDFKKDRENIEKNILTRKKYV